MRLFILATVMFGALGHPALAETCEETFIRLMVDRGTDQPLKIHVTQEIKGGAKSVNWNYQDGKGNWLSEMIEPANAQWSMGLENVLYSSADKGKSWNKIREMDTDPQAQKAARQEQSKTVENAVCGSEELDGKTMDVVEADYITTGNSTTEIHEKFWVDPSNGFIAKSEMLMKSPGFEVFVTQLLEPAPDLKITLPE